MADGVEVARAYVTIVPKTDGTSNKVIGSLVGDAAKGGDRAGAQAGKRFTSAFGGFAKAGGAKAGGGFVSALGTKVTSGTQSVFSKLGGIALKATAAVGIGSVIGQTITGGISRAVNIEDAEAKLRGLGNTTEQVAAIMDNAKASVKGTAYGLGDAATAAGVLAAAGVQTGEGVGEMQGVLSTIASTAAASGREFSEVSSIFGKVAATGKLTGQTLTQLQDSGIPVLSLLAEHYGVAADEASEMVSRGEVDFQTFNQVMNEKMGASAEEMGNTFTGKLMNTKAALSRLGETMFTPMLDGLSDMLPRVMEAIDGVAAQVGEFKAGFSETIDTEGFMAAFQGVADAVGAEFGEGGEAASAKDFGTAFANGLNQAIPLIEQATPLIADVAGVVNTLVDNADKAVPVLVGVGGAFLLFKAASAVAGFVTTVSTALGAIGLTGGAAAGGMTAFAGGEEAAGAAAASAGPSLLEVGGAVLMIGAGVALAGAGLWLMADAAISLAEAGAGAVGVMVGFVAGLLALGAAAYFAGPGLAVAAPGVLAFGGALLMVGAGVGIAAAGISLLAGQLPLIAAFGAAAATNIALMGAGLLVMGSGALVAGAGLVALGAGLVVAAAGLAVATPAMALAAGGCAVLGAALGLMAGAALDVGRGAADMGWGLSTAADAMPRIADNALGAGIGIGQLGDAMAAASANLEAGAGPMREAGDGAQGLGKGVVAAHMAATAAAVAYTNMATAARNSVLGMAWFAAAATAAAASMTAFGAGSAAGMAQAAQAAEQAGSRIRSALSGLDFTASVRFNLGPLPHFRLDGEFNAETGKVPEVKVDWWASGGIFTRPTIFANGVGERGPEAVLPLERLPELIGLDGRERGDVNVYLDYHAGEDAARLVSDIGFRLRQLGRARGVDYHYA